MESKVLLGGAGTGGRTLVVEWKKENPEVLKEVMVADPQESKLPVLVERAEYPALKVVAQPAELVMKKATPQYVVDILDNLGSQTEIAKVGSEKGGIILANMVILPSHEGSVLGLVFLLHPDVKVEGDPQMMKDVPWTSRPELWGVRTQRHGHTYIHNPISGRVLPTEQLSLASEVRRFGSRLLLDPDRIREVLKYYRTTWFVVTPEGKLVGVNPKYFGTDKNEYGAHDRARREGMAIVNQKGIVVPDGRSTKQFVFANPAPRPRFAATRSLEHHVERLSRPAPRPRFVSTPGLGPAVD